MVDATDGLPETGVEGWPLAAPLGPDRIARLVHELRSDDPAALVVLDALVRRLRRDSIRGVPAAHAALEGAARAIGELGASTPRLVEAAYASLAAGEPEASWLAEAALAAARCPTEQADARLCLLWVANWQGDIVHAAALGDAQAEAVAPHDPRRAAVLLIEVATSWLHSGHFEVAEEAATRARDASRPWDDLSDASLLALDWARYGRGNLEAGGRIAISDLRPMAGRGIGPTAFVAMLLVSSDRFAEARRTLALTEAAVRPSHPAALPFVLGTRADLDFRTGNWVSARAAAAEGERLARDIGARNMLGPILVQRARLDAVAGRSEACLERLEEAAAVAADAGMLSLSGPVAATRGLLALGAGDPESACSHLLAARSIRRQAGLVHPGLAPMAADLVEALARAGRDRDAEAAIEELESTGCRLDHPSSSVWAARGRILLGALDSEVVTAATAGPAAVAMPFEQARSFLVLGEQHRRRGERAAARVELNRALATFEYLGATPWATRALAELRAAGGRPTGQAEPPACDLTATLTPQELRVAGVVAGGATNAETAAALYLSTKSIERHLTAIYRKLDVRSRTELSRLIAGVGASEPGGGGRPDSAEGAVP